MKLSDEVVDFLYLEDSGWRIRRSNFWKQPRPGCFLSLNERNIRVLVPGDWWSEFDEIRGSVVHVVLSQGPSVHPSLQGPDMLEIRFEDHSEEPAFLLMDRQKFWLDSMPPKEAPPGPQPCFYVSIWTELDGKPFCGGNWPAYYRQVKTLPSLKPWSSTGKEA